MKNKSKPNTTMNFILNFFMNFILNFLFELFFGIFFLNFLFELFFWNICFWTFCLNFFFELFFLNFLFELSFWTFFGIFILNFYFELFFLEKSSDDTKACLAQTVRRIAGGLKLTPSDWSKEANGTDLKTLCTQPGLFNSDQFDRLVEATTSKSKSKVWNLNFLKFENSKFKL